MSNELRQAWLDDVQKGVAPLTLDKHCRALGRLNWDDPVRVDAMAMVWTPLYAADGSHEADVMHDEFLMRLTFKGVYGQPELVCYDRLALAEAERLGVKYHVIRNRTTKQWYSILHDKFKTEGVCVQREGGEAIGISLEHWEEGDGPPESLFNCAFDWVKPGVAA